MEIDRINDEQPGLLYQLDKAEFAEQNHKLLDSYLAIGAKARGKSGILFEATELNTLEVAISGIAPNSMVYDFSARYGRLLVAAAHSNQQVSISGIEADIESDGIAQLYCFMSGVEDFSIEECSVNQLLQQNEPDMKYDYVISHAPMGLKIDEKIRTRYGDILRDASIGFVVHALESLKENGKAVITVSNGVLFQGASAGRIRKELLDSDFIEAVITLPVGILIGTALPVSMLVLNKNKADARKGTVQFIDASSFGERKRGITSISTEEIKLISEHYHQCSEDNKVSRIMSLIEIQKNDYNLLPSSYVQMEDAESIIGEVQIDRAVYEKQNDTVRLKDIVTIYRGLNTAGSLEIDTTQVRVVQLSDVHDGILHLDTVEKYGIKENTKLELGEIREGDVLITSRGKAMKFAVVPELDDNGPYYLSANFIGLRPHSGVDPYYLLAFFGSPIGESYIRSLRKGANLPILNKSDIEGILLPNLSVEDMNRIGRAYTLFQRHLLNKLACLKALRLILKS